LRREAIWRNVEIPSSIQALDEPLELSIAGHLVM